MIRVDPEEKKNSKTDSRVRTISGGEVRASIPTNVTSKETKKLPEQLIKKEEHKTSRPSPLSLLISKYEATEVKHCCFIDC